MKRILFFIAITTINANNVDVSDLYKKQLEYCDRLKNPKIRNDCKNNLMLIMATNAISNIQNKDKTVANDSQKKNQDPDELENKEIIDNFANIISGIGCIITQPQNPLSIQQGITAMLNGLVNMGSLMTRNLKNIEQIKRFVKRTR